MYLHLDIFRLKNRNEYSPVELLFISSVLMCCFYFQCFDVESLAHWTAEVSMLFRQTDRAVQHTMCVKLPSEMFKIPLLSRIVDVIKGPLWTDWQWIPLNDQSIDLQRKLGRLENDSQFLFPRAYCAHWSLLQPHQMNQVWLGCWSMTVIRFKPSRGEMYCGGCVWANRKMNRLLSIYLAKARQPSKLA